MIVPAPGLITAGTCTSRRDMYRNILECSVRSIQTAIIAGKEALWSTSLSPTGTT
jgi:hypothetical protein